MKKVILGLSAICLIAFTSCKEDATKKIDDNNVAEAAEREQGKATEAMNLLGHKVRDAINRLPSNSIPLLEELPAFL